MRKPKFVFGLIAAAVVSLAAQVQAAIPTYTELSNNGTLQVTTYFPSTSVGVASITSPYGAATITSIASGWVLTFNPSSAFFAYANNLGGGKTTTMSGKLDFILNFDTPIALTANIFEDGIFNTSGNGTVKLFGGIVVAENTHPVASETFSNGNLAGAFVPNPVTGGWTANIATGGFQHTYNSYRITVDNDLTAESLPSALAGSAVIAKKDFQIVITRDGTNGGGQPPVPEPASLGILAVGAVALLARRRA